LVPLTNPRLYPVYGNTLVNRCKPLTRTVSARIPTELHEELRERCNQIGESISDFVKAAIELVLYNHTEFDFGEELLEELEEARRKKG
jgi:predicted DNA-binding protein